MTDFSSFDKMYPNDNIYIYEYIFYEKYVCIYTLYIYE